MVGESVRPSVSQSVGRYAFSSFSASLPLMYLQQIEDGPFSRINGRFEEFYRHLDNFLDFIADDLRSGSLHELVQFQLVLDYSWKRKTEIDLANQIAKATYQTSLQIYLSKSIQFHSVILPFRMQFNG